MIFVHGFSEHVNRYNDFFPRLACQGIQVFAWDQRGWGHSVTKPSQKGLTGPTSQVLDDMAAFVRTKLPSEQPVFLMGHSMGGGEILMLMGDPQYAELVTAVRGWILEAPFIAFSPGQEPSSIKVFLGRLAGKMLPSFQLKNQVPPELLSRDPAVVQSMRDDPLCHDTGTLEGLAGLLDRTALLAEGKVRASPDVKSIFLAHGTADGVCSYDAAVKWLGEQDVQDKTMKSYEGAYHQLHEDHCKEEFTRDLVSWVLERSGGAPSSESGEGKQTGAKL